MPTTIAFTKRFDFSELPKDWRVSRVSVDWEGQPLALIEKGKAPYPGDDASSDAKRFWFTSPPKARHLVHWDKTSSHTLMLEKSTGLFSGPVQPFDHGWLLSGGRNGRGEIYDREGRFLNSLALGTGIEDVQTTSGGMIWVSYSDEGVYRDGLGSQQGLLCFSSSGDQLFKYFDFAEENHLPHIDDCYAMNVVNENEIWLSYYSDFPLVCIRNFQLHQTWKDFGCISKSFGVIGETVLFPKCYTPEGGSQLLRCTLTEAAQSELLEAVDGEGRKISGQFKAAARGSRFYLWTENALYQKASS